MPEGLIENAFDFREKMREKQAFAFSFQAFFFSRFAHLFWPLYIDFNTGENLGGTVFIQNGIRL